MGGNGRGRTPGAALTMLEDLPEFVQLAGLSLFLVLGLLYCFLGYRLFRLLSSAAGLLVGAVISAYAASEYLEFSARDVFLVGVLGGGVGAVLLYLLHHLGVFIFGALFGVLLVVLGARAYQAEPLFPALMLAALAGSVLALARKRVVLVLCTSIAGAATVAGAGFFIVRETEAAQWLLETPKIDYPPYWWVLPGIGLALLGMLVQYLLTAGEEEDARPGMVVPAKPAPAQTAAGDATAAAISGFDDDLAGPDPDADAAAEDDGAADESSALDIADQIAAALDAAPSPRPPAPGPDDAAPQAPEYEYDDDDDDDDDDEDDDDDDGIVATAVIDYEAAEQEAAEAEEAPPEDTDIVERAFEQRPQAEDLVRAEGEWAEQAEQRLARALAEVQSGAARVEEIPEDVEALISQANRPPTGEMLLDAEFTDPEAELAASMPDATEQLAGAPAESSVSLADLSDLDDGADFPEEEAPTVRRTLSSEMATQADIADEPTLQTFPGEPVPVTFPDDDELTARHVVTDAPPQREARPEPPAPQDDDGAETMGDFADMEAPTRQARPHSEAAGPTTRRPSKPEMVMSDVTARRPSRPEQLMAEVTARKQAAPHPDDEEVTKTQPAAPRVLPNRKRPSERLAEKLARKPPPPKDVEIPDWDDE